MTNAERPTMKATRTTKEHALFLRRDKIAFQDMNESVVYGGVFWTEDGVDKAPRFVTIPLRVGRLAISNVLDDPHLGINTHLLLLNPDFELDQTQPALVTETGEVLMKKPIKLVTWGKFQGGFIVDSALIVDHTEKVTFDKQMKGVVERVESSKKIRKLFEK